MPGSLLSNHSTGLRSPAWREELIETVHEHRLSRTRTHDNMFKTPFKAENGFLPVPTAPGLGIEFDEAKFMALVGEPAPIGGPTTATTFRSWIGRPRRSERHAMCSQRKDVMADFTLTQGRYLAFIETYTNLHGYPPAEFEIANALCVSPPSVNNMVKMLERRGLIQRQPGQNRSIRVLVPANEIPAWNGRKQSRSPASADNQSSHIAVAPAAPPSSLYVLSVFLVGGPISDKFANKEMSRVIEIRGDQTLEQLHHAIFKAYDRVEEHLYEFQFGKRPYDPDGPNYGIPSQEQSKKSKKQDGDASTTKLDDLALIKERVFGYWFDFGDNWYHQVQIDKIERAIPTVTYPRVIKRVGKSPPQYGDE